MAALDEPTTGLDPRSRQRMWDVVRKLVVDGKTILLTTQYLEVADQIVVLDGGKVISQGTADELKHSVEVEQVELRFAAEAAYQAAIALVEHLALHRPSLDDVFLTLTGAGR